MNRLNIIIWLSTGVVIGWLVSRLVEMEHRWTLSHVPVEESDSD